MINEKVLPCFRPTSQTALEESARLGRDGVCALLSLIEKLKGACAAL